MLTTLTTHTCFRTQGVRDGVLLPCSSTLLMLGLALATRTQTSQQVVPKAFTRDRSSPPSPSLPTSLPVLFSLATPSPTAQIQSRMKATTPPGWRRATADAPRSKAQSLSLVPNH
ncbi:hypothetical protein B0T25DRAFT_293992 [Lasiosphaeria hispida]|uniref:Uncharacterized protein n=1 Tax=Lasiosphaeria hispida TaxID=260671 RepID=A0AAJ0HCH8_9PEZI|nr:hypothetical protein B0T25DRAFT_293992 [Lasiosphaeria hispida]